MVSLMLALLMVFSLLPMSSISALAAGSSSSVAWQAEDTATAAPAPVYGKHHEPEYAVSNVLCR